MCRTQSFALFLAIFASLSAGADAQQYHLEAITVPGFNAMNSLGRSTGWYYDGMVRPMWTDDGVVIHAIPDLGFGGQGRFINDAGQIAGGVNTDNTYHSRGFFYENGVTTVLGTFGGTDSSVGGINAQGMVVGTANLLGSQSSHAFAYENGVMTDLTPTDTYSGAEAINDARQILVDRTISGIYTVWIYANGQFTNIGDLGGGFATGRALSPSGLATGQSILTGGAGNHAFLYRNGGMTDLGSLNGQGYSLGESVNDSGTVVGKVVATAGGTKAFVSFNGAQMLDLTSLIDSSRNGHNMTDATSINGSGAIIGWEGGYPYLLTPVPEPTTMLVVGIGAVAVLRRRRKGNATSRVVLPPSS
jgi:probable HAF family extracellular repeat protein